jgi:toxin ParE1/3/4
MTKRFCLTPRAEQDLKNIARYTLKIWGKEQRDTYLRAMDRRFGRLAQHPQQGKPRSDAHPGYYSYPQGSHVIFYLIRHDGIDIIGIPHRRMDLANYFGG